MIHRVLRFAFVFVILAAAGICRVSAQEAQGQSNDAAASAPAYKVGAVTVKFVGTANVNEQVVRANIQVREGGDLDETMLDRDIRALYKTGLFEFIEIKREAVDARTFNLVIEVTPKYRVLAVKYEGNKEIKTRRLEKEIKTTPNTALDERQVKEDSEKIKEYYQKEGFNQATVSYSIARDRGTGLGTITFKIREGKKVKILAVNFTGNAHVKTKALRKVMDTKKWWMFSWLMDTGRFKDDQFQDDLDKLRDYYREHGYLDVDIPEERVVFGYPKGGGLVITVAVNEGRQYHIGEITISGNKLHSTVLLKRVASLYAKPGAVFSPSKIDKSVERLEDYYGKDGYLETRVHVTRRPNLKTNDIDLEFKVDESEKLDLKAAKDMFDQLQQTAFKGLRMGLVHGQMKRQESDEVMERFKKHELDILVATTILEVGIDIPNANVMVIEHAERFGLSQLHQLRGRIGRGAQNAMCVLLGDPLTLDGKMRMDAIVQTTDGFKIAEEDLKIRGPGHYFGRHQHGLNELKMFNPITQIEVLEKAREDAILLTEKDPQLIKHRLIKETIKKRYPHYLDLILAG